MKLIVPFVTLILLAAASPAAAGTSCEMTFSMTGWSAFYKTASGSGTVTCSNGQKASVEVTSKGGGVTFGRSRIKDAIGKFTEVDDISEIFGSYAQAEAHAGASKSAKAAVLTKGEVSLSVAGTGSGIDVGVSFGRFTITKKE
jgi:hypothetical protein